jgi:hypothetical protein
MITMRRLGLIAVLALWSGTAEAKVLELYAQAQGGGGTGRGVAGALMDDDFFHGAGGAAYGARVGVEFLWMDGWVEHTQFNDGSLSGTWTQFMFGLDWDFALGDAPKPGEKPKTWGQVGIAGGFGMGTGRQIELPLDNGEISDKGPIAQVSLGAEYRFTKVTAIGVTIPVSYAYLYKNGSVANDASHWYHSVSVVVLAHLRFYIEVK